VHKSKQQVLHPERNSKINHHLLKVADILEKVLKKSSHVGKQKNVASDAEDYEE